MIPSGVILPWNGTHAGIPSGWTRETTLDSKYPKAWSASVAPNVTGGSNTHTHSSTAHGHGVNTHTHSVTLEMCTDTGSQYKETSSNALPAHTHSASTTSSMTGGTLQNTTVTWASVNQEPPYYTVVFIKPSGTMAFLTSGILAYFNKVSAPTNWKLCDGNSGTPDLRGKYLKGAATGANAGTTGGGTSHSHTITHTHTANAHSHTGTSPTNNTEHGTRWSSGSSGAHAWNGHTHTITLNNATDTVNNYTNTTAGSSTTLEVAYKKMGLFQNAGGSVEKGMIAMWLGSVSDIPVGWYLCDGNNGTVDLRDKFIKAGQDLTQNGNTGGANTHTHSSVSHTHTATSHTHTGSHGEGSLNVTATVSENKNVALKAHTHALSVTSTTTTYTNTSLDCVSSDHQPAYRTVAYIEYQFSAGGSFLLGIV